MRFRFDQFGKQLARATLESSGTATADAEIAPDAQRADLLFEPDPAREAERAKLGLLGRLAATPCLIEIYRGAPSTEEVRACLRKHLAFWWARVREAQRTEKPAEPPMLWILAAGRPGSALNAFAFVRARGFPAGVHLAPGGLRVGLVVASELPRIRSTLLVRLMASGRGLGTAVEDLSALPADAPEHAMATPVLLRLHQALMGKRRPTREEQEFVMSTQNIVQELVEKGRRQGLREGQRAVQELVEKGRREGLREGQRAVQELVEKGRREGLREGQRAVQELVEKGRREGLREGQRAVQELVEKGRRQGRAEGQREGRQEGRRQGRLKEARAALRSVLARRGLTPSAEDEAKIDACTRTATLRRWLDQAIDAPSATEALR